MRFVRPTAETDFDRWSKCRILYRERFFYLRKVAVAKDADGIIPRHWSVDALTDTVEIDPYWFG